MTFDSYGNRKIFNLENERKFLQLFSKIHNVFTTTYRHYAPARCSDLDVCPGGWGGEYSHPGVAKETQIHAAVLYISRVSECWLYHLRCWR